MKVAELVQPKALKEGLWIATNKYKLSDDPKKDSKNGEDYLDVAGFPGGIKSLRALEVLLKTSGGEITDEVLAWKGGASVMKWLRWVKENGRKVKPNYDQYVGY